jgi:hypothetical protein
MLFTNRTLNTNFRSFTANVAGFFFSLRVGVVMSFSTLIQTSSARRFPSVNLALKGGATVFADSIFPEWFLV